MSSIYMQKNDQPDIEPSPECVSPDSVKQEPAKLLSGLPVGLRRWSARLAAPLALACLTAYAAHQYLESQVSRQVLPDGSAMIERIVASQDLPAGTVLAADHLAVRAVPQAWVGADSYAPDEFEGIVGMQLSGELLMGIPVTRAVLRRRIPNEFLDQLALDRRAVTLTVNRSSGAQNVLMPGEVIDLYVTFEHKGHHITSLLLSQVRILQTLGAEDGMQGASAETITLDVAQGDAAKLVAAQQGGVLTAVQVPSSRVGSEKRVTALQTSKDEQRYTDHLAGYAGIDTPFDQLQMPDIIYGDQVSAGGEDMR